MSVSDAYFRYLDHFGRTVTLRDAADAEGDFIALRHDVDHDIDMALEMAYWESERGIRSTYFMLHSADYFAADGFLDKAMQIQAFGHEVGLHLNFLAQWYRGEIEDPVSELDRVLGDLRQAGLNVSGVSAHGDKTCYEAGFINYWMFSDLRPRDAASESGLSAEGVPGNDPRFSIDYPSTGKLTREDGKVLEFWQSSFSAHGLDYHATHLNNDRYFSDSGGNWTRSPDPLLEDLSTGRHQVLMHPIHWMAAPKRHFFYSTARSGSKWLATLLDKATSLEARHEYALNHQLVNGEAMFRKHTGPGFRELQFDRGRVKALLGDYGDIIKDRPLDQAEVNVYLEEFRDLVEETFPEAREFHLVRDPASVVRSIYDREWYRADIDTNHKQPAAGEWQSLDAFARCCWYVRDVLENLDDLDARRVRLEEISQGADAFSDAMRRLGIPFYPELLEPADFDPLNRNKRWVLGEYAEWSFRNRCVFLAILGSLRTRLGYRSLQGRLVSKLMAGIGRLLVRRSFREPEETGREQLDFDHRLELELDASRYFPVGGSLSTDREPARFAPNGERNALLIFGGSRWGKAVRNCGWPVEHGMHFAVSLRAGISAGQEARLYLLYYDAEGGIAERKLAAYIRSEAETIEVLDRPPSIAEVVDVALFSSMDEQPAEITLTDIRLAWASNEENRP